MVGDREHGVITLPLRFGVAPAARMMAPFSWSVAGDSDPRRMSDPDHPGTYLLTETTCSRASAWGSRPWGASTALLLLANPDELALTRPSRLSNVPRSQSAMCGSRWPCA